MKCPTCGHTPTAKRAQPIVDVNIAGMNESGMRAYFTRTAPFCDVQFMIDNGRGLSPELIADARELASTVDAAGRFTSGQTRASFYRQYSALSARRRKERDDRHWRAVVIPARKAAAWADARATDAARYDVDADAEALAA